MGIKDITNYIIHQQETETLTQYDLDFMRIRIMLLMFCFSCKA